MYQIVIGIEANPVIFEVPEFEKLISSNSQLFDLYENTYIFTEINDAISVKELLLEVDLFAEEHTLIMLENGKKYNHFDDYGFKTQKCYYLYCDSLIAFTLYGNDKDSSKMATHQMREQLVFTTTMNEKEVFFIDHYHDQLVLGITHAYKCEVHFLELDKREKKL